MEQQQPQIATDPNLAAEQAQAKQDQIKALQVQSQGDTASLMARYGTLVALSNTGVAAPAPSYTPTYSAPR